jgi:hypothetical protein
MEFILKAGRVVAVNSDKTEISFAANGLTVAGYVIDFPGEYERSGVLVEAVEQQGGLVFHLKTEGVKIAYFDHEKFESDKPFVDFLGDVDVLILKGSKESAKAAEGIDARVVIPYGAGAQPFLAALGQNLEPATKYKLKEADLSGEVTKYVALVEA